jgi:hypothetical protein
MAYEKFRRTRVRVESPALSVVPNGTIAVNAAACRALIQAGVKAVVLLWDESTHTFALKAAQKADRDAFAVSIVPGAHSGSVRAKSFMTHIGWNALKRETVPATWNESERMLEAVLPLASLRPRKAKAKVGLQVEPKGSRL